MSDRSTRESPLVRFDLEARAASNPARARIVCSERPFLGHINLRGDAGDPRFIASVASVIGTVVPISPNTVSRGHDQVVYWLGPDEWLIVTTDEREAAIARDLRDALANCFAAVTEVSGGQTVISLSGDAVRDMLAKGCPLDLHARVFGIDRCAQSHLAKAPILIRQIDAAPSFEIVVRRSFADYLWLWLEDAAAEYGLGIEAPAGSIATPQSATN